MVLVKGFECGSFLVLMHRDRGVCDVKSVGPHEGKGLSSILLKRIVLWSSIWDYTFGSWTFRVSGAS